MSSGYPVTQYDRSRFFLYLSTDWRWLGNCYFILSSTSPWPKHCKISILEFLENVYTFLCFHYRMWLPPTRLFSVFRIWNSQTLWQSWKFLQIDFFVPHLNQDISPLLNIRVREHSMYLCACMCVHIYVHIEKHLTSSDMKMMVNKTPKQWKANRRKIHVALHIWIHNHKSTKTHRIIQLE